MNEPEIMSALEKVRARFRGVIHIGPPEVIGEGDVVLFEHQSLRKDVVMAIRVSDLCEVNLLLAIASTHERWSRETNRAAD